MLFARVWQLLLQPARVAAATKTAPRKRAFMRVVPRRGR
jgi:hypothetical protein